MRVGVITLALLLAVPGCAWLQEQMRPAPARGPGWATAEVDQVSFDGEELSFRLLIGAMDGGVVLDRRLIENAGVNLVDVQDCDGGPMPIPHIVTDFFPTPPAASDVLELPPGHWYGATERFLLFIAHEDGGGTPACVDATFTVRLETAANPNVPIRVKGTRLISEVERTDAGVP